MSLRASLATLLLLASALCGGCAWLRPPAEAAGPPVPPPIDLVVDSPAPLKALLEQHLDIARLLALRSAPSSADDTIDDAEWARLIAAAPAQARDLAQTEGFFEAFVQVRREPGTRPPRVVVTVQPGPRTVVRERGVTLQGPLRQALDAGDARAAALARQLPDTGALQPGRAFRNDDWGGTKQQLLARLRAGGHATATLADSRADIDLPSATATLSVALDSGPLFRAGAVKVEGLKLHEERTVRRLAGFAPGTPLTEQLLLDFQERLQKSNLFQSASVTFDPDPAQADAAPVTVKLSEAPLQQATVGIGYSANVGPRTSLEHTHRRLLGWAVTSHNKVEWGRDAQTLTSDFYSHPSEKFTRNLLGVQAERVKSDTDIVLSQRVRLGRSSETPRIERLYFLEWLRSRQTGGDSAGSDASALSANAQLVHRRLDSLLLPTQGRSLSLQLGAGRASSNTGESGPFARLYGRATGYWRLGTRWYANARIEAGQIVKQDAVIVPDALGFRAGGDDSVRGYAYRSLAPQRDGVLFSGNVLLTGSVELARPVSENLPSVWGAVFVDAGRAAERWQDYKPALGAGVGVRWRSPIGPLRADLAWGQEVRALRLHLSVGVTF